MVIFHSYVSLPEGKAPIFSASPHVFTLLSARFNPPDLPDRYFTSSQYAYGRVWFHMVDEMAPKFRGETVKPKKQWKHPLCYMPMCQN